MTGIAFLKRLSFQLDFLNEDDQKTVVAFYERKLAGANTLLEEEAIVKSFGSPEHIAKKLKEAYLSHLAEAENAPRAEDKLPESNSVSVNENDEETDIMKNDDQDDLRAEAQEEEDELIFSKPATPKKAAEMIHSLENKEVKSLYGEKVVIEDRSEPIEEITIEPIDDENGLTEEEIRLAKEETLEKANNFTTASIEIPPELLSESEDKNTVIEDSGELSSAEELPTIAIETKDTDNESKKVEEPSETEIPEVSEEEPEISEEIQETAPAPVTKNDEPLTDETDNEASAEESIVSENSDVAEAMDEMIPAHKKAGLITGLFPASMSRGFRIFFSVLLSIIVSPIIFIVFGAGILTYAVSSIVMIAIAVLAFAVIAALIVLGVAELIYGFSSLFDTVSVALVEIGIGTVVFGIVTAVSALIYEFLFGVVPKAIKGLTKIFIMYLKKVSSFLYGGNA